MSALVEYTPPGAFIAVKPTYTASDADERARETQQRQNRARAAQRATEDRKAAEEALNRRIEVEKSKRVEWKGRGIVLYVRPIGPKPQMAEPAYDSRKASDIVQEVAFKHGITAT